MRNIKILILLSMAGLLFSSCYTRLAVVQREKIYIPEEEIVQGEDVDTVYIEEEEYPYISHYHYYDYPRYGGSHHFINDPWYWDDYYFNFSFYGHYRYPYSWHDYYWYRPLVVWYPGYYYDDWYYGGWHPGRRGGNFKPRPFDRGGHSFDRGGTRIGTIRGGTDESDFRPTRTASRGTVTKRADGSSTVIRRGDEQFRPVRTTPGEQVSKRKGTSITVKRRGDSKYRAKSTSGRKTAKVVRDGGKTTKRVRYIVKKSKDGSRSRSSSGKSTSKSKSKSVKKSSSSVEKKSSSGNKRSSYSSPSRSSSFSSPSKSSSSRSSRSSSSGSRSSKSSSRSNSSSKRR